MSEFMADLLSSVLVTHSLTATEVSFTRATRRRRLPPRQHLISHLRVPMPQPVHIAQPCRLALPVVDMPLLNVSLVRRNQRARPDQPMDLIQHRTLFRRSDWYRPIAPAFCP